MTNLDIIIIFVIHWYNTKDRCIGYVSLALILLLFIGDNNMEPWDNRFYVDKEGYVRAYINPDKAYRTNVTQTRSRPYFPRSYYENRKRISLITDPYKQWYETHFAKLNEGDYVIADGNDYSHPWKNPIHVTNDTEYVTWMGVEYKRFPERFGVIPVYFMSRLGKVLSFVRGDGRIMQTSTTYGYEKVVLGIEPNRFWVMIHRMVAEIYLGDVTDMQVDHKDCNPLNNHVDNLQIVTREQNIWLRDSRNDRFFDGKINKAFGWDTELPEVALDICWD